MDSTPSDVSHVVEFLKVLDKLKSVQRRVYTSEGRHENTAEHTFHLAMMVWVFADFLERKVDVSRALQLALVHDIVEIHAGDTFFFDDAGHKDKREREERAIEKLTEKLPPKLGSMIKTAWEEFENSKTPEAKYVQAMDKLHPFIQHILSQSRALKEHDIAKDEIIRRKAGFFAYDAFLQKLFGELLSKI